LHEDAGVTFDGHDSWAEAHCHIVEAVEMFGVIVGAFFVAAPSNVLLSGIIKELLLDFFDVFTLISHLLPDVFGNIFSHSSHSSLGFLGLFNAFSQFVGSNSFIKVEVTFAFMGTFTIE
jgi:hypothetical protein